MDKMLVQFGAVSEDARRKVLAAKAGIDVAEYRPRWAAPASYNTPQALAALNADVQAGLRQGGQGAVTIVSRSPRRIVLSVDMPTQGWVKLPHFYYPGWRAVSLEAVADLPIR